MLSDYTMLRIRKAGFIAECVGDAVVVKDALEWEAPLLAMITKSGSKLFVSDVSSGDVTTLPARSWKDLVLSLVRKYPRKKKESV